MMTRCSFTGRHFSIQQEQEHLLVPTPYTQLSWAKPHRGKRNRHFSRRHTRTVQHRTHLELTRHSALHALARHDMQVALALSIKTSSDKVQTCSLRTDLAVHDMRVVLPLGRV